MAYRIPVGTKDELRELTESYGQIAQIELDETPIDWKLRVIFANGGIMTYTLNSLTVIEKKELSEWNLGVLYVVKDSNGVWCFATRSIVPTEGEYAERIRRDGSAFAKHMGSLANSLRRKKEVSASCFHKGDCHNGGCHRHLPNWLREKIHDMMKKKHPSWGIILRMIMGDLIDSERFELDDRDMNEIMWIIETAWNLHPDLATGGINLEVRDGRVIAFGTTLSHFLEDKMFSLFFWAK
jgi:hypothetical protein